MTAAPDPTTRRILVVGSTFGQMYLDALRHCQPHAVAVGLLARGSDRSRRIAEMHGIPLLTSIDDIRGDTDLACIAVRADSVGGTGTTLATRFLERGISVLHELPASTGDVTACLRAAHLGGARFAVADLYRWLPAVRVFRAAAGELISLEPPLAVDAHLSIQPAYALARLLTEIGLPLRPLALRPSQGGAPLVSGTLGDTPVSVRYATVLDARDTDNDVRFPSVSLHTRSGTLTLADVHGPVLWIPTLHLPEQGRDSTAPGDGALAQTATSTELFHPQHTHLTILTDLWPKALAGQILAMFDDASNGAAQRTLQVAQLWEALTGGVGFPAAGQDDGDHLLHTELQALLRDTAHSALGEIGETSEKDEDSP
ncbi:MAG: Gfo/Idh/MocA family oxidoreductase [Dermatophilaceae bacterium]